MMDYFLVAITLLAGFLIVRSIVLEAEASRNPLARALIAMSKDMNSAVKATRLLSKAILKITARKYQ